MRIVTRCERDCHLNGKTYFKILRDTHHILFDPRIHKRLYELSLKKNES